MKIDRITLLDTFVKVVESRSLSSVARNLGISQSTVSRRLNELENKLGVRLLHRTTRAMAPTRDGQVLFEYASEIVAIADRAAAEISGDQAGLEGPVRVGTTADLGQRFLLEHVTKALEKWPRISIDLRYIEGVPDLLGNGLDLALWSGEVANQSIIKRKVGMTRWILVASKQYLDAAGRPSEFNDLKGHQCIRNTASPFGNDWKMRDEKGKQFQSVAVSGRIVVNTFDAALAAARMNQGIAMAPKWLFRGSALPAELERVLPKHAIEDTEMQLLFPSRKLAARTRALLDLLAEAILADERIR